MLALLLPALLLLPQLFVAQHSPLEFSQQEALDHQHLAPLHSANATDNGIEISRHQHTHDDGNDHEQQLNHLHGHNPADHAHDSPHPLLPLSVILPNARYSPIHTPYTSVPFRQSPPIRPPKIAFYA